MISQSNADIDKRLNISYISEVQITIINNKGRKSMMETQKLYARSKIWLEDSDGKVVFGLGRYKIFKTIQTLGSLNAAAKELKMGYPAIWARIHATEERLGKSLLVKKTGGASGGGSQLTPLAEELIDHFEKIQASVEQETDSLFAENLGAYMDLDLKKGGNLP